MSRFIRVTTEHTGIIRINVEHIVSYGQRFMHPAVRDKEMVYPTIICTTIDRTENSDGYFVKETPEQIDRMLNPGMTP